MTVSTQQDLHDVVTRRHSCRAFLPESLPGDLIMSILNTAQQAPSWCNTQPWQLIVTSGSSTDDFRRALLAHADSEPHISDPDFPKPAVYTEERLTRRRACGWALYESVGVERGDRAGSALQARENYAFFGAPHVAIITTHTELGVYGAVDCGLHLATFLYAAEAHGVGAIAQAALANHAPFIRDYFQIPAEQLILFGVSFGWPDQDHPANAFRTTRAELEQVVRWVGDPA